MLEFFTPFVFSQIFMACALCTDLLSFQFKNRKYIVIFLAISCLLIATHYFLLDRFSAGFITAIGAIRYTISYFSTDKRILLLFITINTIILYLTFTEFYDLIYYMGVNLGIIGTFQDQEHNRVMRIVIMLGTVCAIIYNVLIFTPMGILTESGFLISNLIGYYRFYIKKG